MTDKDQTNQAPEDENKLIAQRREKLHQIRQRREAFPNDFDRTDLSEKYIANTGAKMRRNCRLRPDGSLSRGGLSEQEGHFLLYRMGMVSCSCI